MVESRKNELTFFHFWKKKCQKLKILKIRQSKHHSVKAKFEIVIQSFVFPKYQPCTMKKQLIRRDLTENRNPAFGLSVVVRGA